MFKAPNGKDCFLVAIEGPDRLGKATQAQMLEDALTKRKHKATVEEIPYDDGVTHPIIYEMLHDGTALQFPIVFQTLHGLNRRYFQKSFLPTLARHYDVVILDRWNLSTRVYGPASNVPNDTTAVILKDIVEPDITLVFDGVGFPKEGLDFYEKDRQLQEMVRRSYLGYCEREPKLFVKIDANRPREDVHENVLDAVLDALMERLR